MIKACLQPTQVTAKAEDMGDIRNPPSLDIARAESGAFALEAKVKSTRVCLVLCNYCLDTKVRPKKLHENRGKVPCALPQSDVIRADLKKKRKGNVASPCRILFSSHALHHVEN